MRSSFERNSKQIKNETCVERLSDASKLTFALPESKLTFETLPKKSKALNEAIVASNIEESEDIERLEERAQAQALANSLGRVVAAVPGDGSCLFHSYVVGQYKGIPEVESLVDYSQELREMVVAHIDANTDDTNWQLDETRTDWIQSMSRTSTYESGLQANVFEKLKQLPWATTSSYPISQLLVVKIFLLFDGRQHNLFCIISSPASPCS